ncbi:ABC transporter substrate-binding protein [Jannaschia aquimarina]
MPPGRSGPCRGAIWRVVAAAIAAVVATEALAEGPAGPPARVVSMNLCTDQLAMLLAAPGQLVSVSSLAQDPRGSAMATEAAAYPSNRGLAEEIYLLDPDLVIAGSFSTQATVDMLRRLGVPVAVLDPAYSMADIGDRIEEMGRVLGRAEAAAQLRAEFEAGLAALREEIATRPRAALYYANGYTSGDRTLAGEILLAAGFANIAAEAGLPEGGVMPLEILAMAEPDALVTGRPYPRASRAEEILDHPVLHQMRERRAAGAVSDSEWVCGTPHVLQAVGRMRALRERLE